MTSSDEVSEQVPSVRQVLGSKSAPRAESLTVRNCAGLSLANNQAVCSSPFQSVYCKRKFWVVAAVPPTVVLLMNQLPFRQVVESRPVEVSCHESVGCVIEVVPPLGVTTHCGS